MCGLSVALFFIQNWSGFTVIVFYAVRILDRAGTGLSSLQSTALLGSLQVSLPVYRRRQQMARCVACVETATHQHKP